jgi:hypothetical protein
MASIHSRRVHRIAARALVTALCGALLFAGCSSGTPGGGGGEDDPPCGYGQGCFQPCAVDADCADNLEAGLVCRELRREEPGSATERLCTRPCTRTDDCRDPETPDTPVGFCRCLDGSESGFCDSFFFELPTDEPPPELCPADYDLAEVCNLLCWCPCSYHGLCQGSVLDVEACKQGCQDAADDFPACRDELDAFYSCAHDKADCIDGLSGGTQQCANGWPYCWGTPPDQACPVELMALSTCAMAPYWQFFYPSTTPGM